MTATRFPRTITVRNVNEALPVALLMFNDPSCYTEMDSRNGPVREINGPVITTYLRPLERVLFDPVRDANPFFHFFESLWILAGRTDVAFLKYFVRTIGDYSDDNLTFHGAYGGRLGIGGQLRSAINELRVDPDTRRAVVALWQPNHDAGYVGRDMPCNTTIYFKIRAGQLHMTVCNRSNDMLWGAYGANVVQFSTLLEYVAARVGVPVGTYTQISDSFHVYTDTDVWKRMAKHDNGVIHDRYLTGNNPKRLVVRSSFFDQDLDAFMSYADKCIAQPDAYVLGGDFGCMEFANPVFRETAYPLLRAYGAYKSKDWHTAFISANVCEADDWRAACLDWLARREHPKET